MEANYLHKDSTTLVQDELVKNELNQIELQYNALKQQKFNELLKENQELKQKYLNAAADYETTMAEKNELKRQVEDISEELELVRCDLHNRTSKRDRYERELNECLSQQKEFIKYLEDYLKLFDNKDINEEGSYDTIEEILQKYKSIIGVSE